ncbi:hypothetical protein B0H21DRAFT_694402 [Amylocystis lapponica]|nr:hypothetical protein B0H21DRAFT_694402 [Amylocystis lapponica]
MSSQSGPGTGALGGPPVQHNYKRAVARPPPRHFTAELLPPARFGNGFCYGLRICPFRPGEGQDDGSSKSSKSTGSASGSGSGSLTEYEVWRRWEDCLWFQDLLESEYALMSRTKRQRLAAGKGVKKDGVYLRSDQAASFESLPPGPEARSVAKDIHQIVPKLTKKGTFFRASQATVDQRGREFAAMITALLAEDVPMLIKELRETRIVRDFFAVWRRDKDHERKMLNARPSSSGGNVRNSIASSAFSMYFSASNISLQLPPTFSDLPPSPAVPIHPREPRRDSADRSPPTRQFSPESPGSPLRTEFPHMQAPMSAPGLSPPDSDRNSLSLHISEDDNHTDRINAPLSAPSRIQSARWSHSTNWPFPSQETEDDDKDVPVLLVPEGQPTVDYGAGLQALPEDQELVPSMMNLALGIPDDVRPPVRRSRINSCPDRANRNCVVFAPPHAANADAPLDSLDSVIEALRMPDLASVSVSDRPKTPTATGSSRPSSFALSTFSADLSPRSSWRTSVASDMSAATGFSSTFARDSCVDLDRALASSPTPLYSPRASPTHHPPSRTLHAPRASIATMNSLISNSSVDAVLPRRPSPPPRSLSAGSCRPLSFSSMAAPPAQTWYDAQEDLLDAYFYGTHVPAPPAHVLTAPVRPDPGLRAHPPPPPPPRVHSPPGADAFTLKAVLGPSIVLLRTPHGTPLADVRARLREKFAGQEDVALPAAFALGYHAPDAERPRSARGRSRSSSVSTVGTDAGLPLRPIACEADWRAAVAGCAGKLTVRIEDAAP